MIYIYTSKPRNHFDPSICYLVCLIISPLIRTVVESAPLALWPKVTKQIPGTNHTSWDKPISFWAGHYNIKERTIQCPCRRSFSSRMGPYPIPVNSHKNILQKLCLTEFIKKDDWLPQSPDCCELKDRISQCWEDISLAEIRKSIGSWKNRLRAVCSRNGDRLTTFSKKLQVRLTIKHFSPALHLWTIMFVFSGSGFKPKLLSWYVYTLETINR
jgi:hypothetical protein